MTRGALWLGPDEWLMVGLPGTEDDLVAELERAFDGTHHSVVDVSANRVGRSSSTGADRLRSDRQRLRTRPRPAGGWVPGRCAQTLFARAQVLLQEMIGATRMFVRPSFADYVVDRLLVAADMRG